MLPMFLNCLLLDLTVIDLIAIVYNNTWENVGLKLQKKKLEMRSADVPEWVQYLYQSFSLNQFNWPGVVMAWTFASHDPCGQPGFDYGRKQGRTSLELRKKHECIAGWGCPSLCCSGIIVALKA